MSNCKIDDAFKVHVIKMIDKLIERKKNEEDIEKIKIRNGEYHNIKNDINTLLKSKKKTDFLIKKDKSYILIDYIKYIIYYNLRNYEKDENEMNTIMRILIEIQGKYNEIGNGDLSLIKFIDIKDYAPFNRKRILANMPPLVGGKKCLKKSKKKIKGGGDYDNTIIEFMSIISNIYKSDKISINYINKNFLLIDYFIKSDEDIAKIKITLNSINEYEDKNKDDEDEEKEEVNIDLKEKIKAFLIKYFELIQKITVLIGNDFIQKQKQLQFVSLFNLLMHLMLTIIANKENKEEDIEIYINITKNIQNLINEFDISNSFIKFVNESFVKEFSLDEKVYIISTQTDDDDVLNKILIKLNEDTCLDKIKDILGKK